MLLLPGMYPKIVNRMLIHKSTPRPLSNNTPSGGKIIAKMTLQISDQVRGILKERNGYSLAILTLKKPEALYLNYKNYFDQFIIKKK